MKHGEQQQSTDISRRTFLEQATSSLALLSLPSFMRRGEPRQPAVIETEASHITWNRDSILTNFPTFLDDLVIDDLVIDGLTNWERRFAGLKMPPALEQLQHLLEDTQFRANLESGFRSYGRQVADLAKRLDTISPSADLYGASMTALRQWWEPFVLLTRIFRAVPGAGNWSTSDTKAIASLATWFEPLTKDPKMERQRPFYIERAKEKTKRNKVVEHIAQNWDITHINLEKGETKKSNEENKQTFLRMLEKYLEVFPNAMSNIANLYVGNIEDGEQVTTRDHYSGKDGNGDIFLSHDVEKAMNFYREYEDTINNPRPNGRGFASFKS